MLKKQIGSMYFEHLGRIIAHFTSLDNSLTQLLNTLTNTESLETTNPSVKSTKLTMDFQTWRHIVSSIEFSKRVEIFSKVSVIKYPHEKENIKLLKKRLLASAKHRNELCHYVWHEEGQLGWNVDGKFKLIPRTLDDLDKIDQEICKLNEEVMFFDLKNIIK